MVDDLDLFRSARRLVDKLGADEALATASRRGKALLEQGDVIGAAAWRAIRSAIKDLGDVETKGKSVH